jgi:hypothetical protein
LEGESYEIVTVETPYLGDLVIVSYLSNDNHVYTYTCFSVEFGETNTVYSELSLEPIQ